MSLSPPRLAPRSTIYCLFCGRPHHEVGHMIVAHRGAAICDSCIDECAAKLAAIRICPPPPEVPK